MSEAGSRRQRCVNFCDDLRGESSLPKPRISYLPLGAVCEVFETVRFQVPHNSGLRRTVAVVTFSLVEHDAVPDNSIEERLLMRKRDVFAARVNGDVFHRGICGSTGDSLLRDCDLSNEICLQCYGGVFGVTTFKVQHLLNTVSAFAETLRQRGGHA